MNQFVNLFCIEIYSFLQVTKRVGGVSVGVINGELPSPTNGATANVNASDSSSSSSGNAAPVSGEKASV